MSCMRWRKFVVERLQAMGMGEIWAKHARTRRRMSLKLFHTEPLRAGRRRGCNGTHPAGDLTLALCLSGCALALAQCTLIL
jgi:hypothetical protein